MGIMNETEAPREARTFNFALSEDNLNAKLSGVNGMGTPDTAVAVAEGQIAKIAEQTPATMASENNNTPNNIPTSSM